LRTNSFFARAAASLAVAAALAVVPATAEPAPSRAVTPIDRSPIVPFNGKLFDGRSISVAADGSARITTLGGAKPLRVDRRTLSPAQRAAFRPGATAFDHQRALFGLTKPLPAAYSAHDLIVVFKDGTTIPTDHNAVPDATLRTLRTAGARRTPSSSITPRYTTDDRLNVLFARFGVSRTDRLFANVSRGTLAQHASRAASRLRAPVLNIGNAFRLTVTNMQLPAALRELAKMPNVAYAGHNFRFASMALPGAAVPAAKLQEARLLQPRRAFGRSASAAHGARGTLSVSGAAALDNYTVTSSGQAFLNAPGVDAIAAFDEIAQNFNGQLPGTGVTITNVSLGDLDDASALANPSDPCNAFVAAFGPTTRMIGSQRYLDLPSMPLIPTYVGSSSATLSGSGETCGVDPFLEEIALDFTVMSPLPHALQRPGESGEGLSDLLGIAPGAAYRLVVPAKNDMGSLLGAVLGAASQSPAPDVITMSIGWGYDTFGFPGRYFEDDPLARSVAATVTTSYNIPFFIAANDGTRSGKGAPIGSSGGSAATNVAPVGVAATTLDDIGFTTGPSSIPDTGAIDVGGTTLDDVESANPQNPANAALASTLAFPETRFNGFNAFSSGFGSRVNVSAPADNILTLVHSGPRYDSTIVSVNGGTSASAPEAAAVAAVAIQVARLTGHPFASVAALRSFLAATGTRVAQSQITDVAIEVGPQVSARRAVEALLGSAHVAPAPSVGRVAVMQRKTACTEYGSCNPNVVLEYTDPAIISLRLPQLADGSYTGARTNDYITIAPDWENLPPNAQFRLTVAGKPNAVLATTPFARLLPAQILGAAGLPLASAGVRTVSLTYQSVVGLHVAAQTTFDLRFGPADGTSTAVLAAVVPSVVTGTTMPVAYDLSMLPAGFGRAYLSIWIPSRYDWISRLAYSQLLPDKKGTLNVPVSALAGAGVYMVEIWYGGSRPDTNPAYSSTNAFARVVPSGSARPPAPLVGSAASVPSHSLEVSFGDPVTISWDVSNVAHATGAIVEVSFGAPTVLGNFNLFGNPNGNAVDANGLDSPSVYYQQMNGVAGSMTLDARRLNVLPGVFHSVRVLATNGGMVVGEASDTTAFMMDGVAPPDGGSAFAHGLNTAGTDGLLMSIQEGCITIGPTGTYNYYGTEGTGTAVGSAAMTFDQQSLQVTNPAVVSSINCNSQPMLFANDTGFLYDRSARAFAVVPAVSSPAPSAQFVAMPPGAIPNDIVFEGSSLPPISQAGVFQSTQEYVAGSATSSVASFFGFNTLGAGTLGAATAFSMDLSSLAQTPLITFGDFTSFGFPVVLGSAFDPTKNVAYYAVFDAFDGYNPVNVLAIDYNTNGYSRVSTGGYGPGNDMAGPSFMVLDATTQKLLFVNDSLESTRLPQLHIVDLRTKAVTLVTPPEYAPNTQLDLALVDDVNHLFIVLERERHADQTDLRLPSGLSFYDEAGNVVKHLRLPYMYWPFVGGSGPGEQLTYVNGHIRRLFIGSPPNPTGVFEPQLMAIDY
jgi:hypothetical protein